MTPRFAIGLVPVILGGALVLFFSSRKDEEPGNPTSPAAATLAEPDFKLDVAQWHSEFARDAAAAVEKYKGKIVELSGTVEFVSEDLTASVGCVFLQVEGASLQDRCATTDRQPWLRVSPGSKVRIRGNVPEFGLPRDLVNAEIVDAGPNPAARTSARHLAQEYAADATAATAEYDDVWANLTGEVAVKTAQKDGSWLVTLTGDSGVVVTCCFGQRNQKALEAVKVGATVTVFGQLSLWKDKEILLNSTLLTEAK